MKLAESSHKKLEEFFKEHLQDQEFQLPVIYFYAGRFTKMFTWIIKVHGITFGRRIYIRPALISVNTANNLKLSENLAAHEIAHVLQYKKHGFIGFFYIYLKSFWGNLWEKRKWDLFSRQEAYLEIPFEVEARSIASSFEIWNRDR